MATAPLDRFRLDGKTVAITGASSGFGFHFAGVLASAGARVPQQLLELYSFEASPFSRIAREALSSLELAYRLRNVASGSEHREAFVARSGRMMVPWLADPNTGVEMFESADIAEYLVETYAL